MSTKVPLAMLLLGLAMLWPVPLGGSLLLVAAGVGLAIAWEAEVSGETPPAALPARARWPE